jgi:putative tryptophan/tyrosine transport system substrate-binding protein
MVLGRGVNTVRRREFIKLLSNAATAWPLTAQAQRATLPVIGFLDERLPDEMGPRLRAFHQGLNETGFVDGDNVSILYRFAENQTDRLAGLAADLVQRNVTVIASVGFSASLAIKAATTTIPGVFIVAQDPVGLGLVASIARPGGNLTGVNIVSAELTAKRLALLRELIPGAARVAVLVSSADVANTKSTLQIVETAARGMGLQISVFNANSASEINAAFESIEGSGADALFVGASVLMNGRRVQLVQLAAFYRLPATYPLREYAEVGGLMSYGADLADAYRQFGAYTGRILKGTKPADLPVVQANKFDLVINMQTARMLKITVPSTLLAIADEVIE